MGGGTLAPNATIPADAWNADRLNEYLSKIDAEIAAGEYEHSVTLSYTCLEGFYGAFVRAKYKQETYSHEIITLSKEVKVYLKNSIRDYPDEVLNGITQAAHAVDKARNQFSQSHFASEAGSWLATYVRDLVNTQIRLLLHFLSAVSNLDECFIQLASRHLTHCFLRPVNANAFESGATACGPMSSDLI